MSDPQNWLSHSKLLYKSYLKGLLQIILHKHDNINISILFKGFCFLTIFYLFWKPPWANEFQGTYINGSHNSGAPVSLFWNALSHKSILFFEILSCCRIKRVQNSKALFTLIEGRIFTDCLLSQIFFDGFIRWGAYLQGSLGAILKKGWW